MNKYMLTVFALYGSDIESYSITVTDGIDFGGFPAEIGNPNYDQFLTQAELTDKQVHALTPEVWYDFPA